MDKVDVVQTAQRADIDEDAWAMLYRAASRPFLRPKAGRIAVKVFNRHGDEAVRVFLIR